MSRAKQIAARQAELSRRKKHKGLVKPVALDPGAPSMGNATGSSSAEPVIELQPQGAPARPASQPQAPRSQPGQLSTPMARLPSRGGGASAAGPAQPKRAAVGKLPYLGADLRTIGVITGAMIVILIIVAIVRG